MMMANGDIGLTPVQKKAIVDFVRGGKGFVGVHCATVMMYDFPEYGEMLGGYYFNSIFTPLLGNDVPVNQRHTGDSAFRAHLTGGIRWSLGLEN
jgi:hypothetical protein